jgi:hypothetical protein
MSSVLWCVMNGRAAAPPAIACSVGPSTSQKPCLIERSADGANDFGAVEKRFHHAIVESQVGVPHPLAKFGVRDPACACRERARASWSGTCSRISKDGQFAGVRSSQSSVDADQSPRSNSRSQLEILFADLVQARRKSAARPSSPSA